jgi:hypothetical protein
MEFLWTKNECVGVENDETHTIQWEEVSRTGGTEMTPSIEAIKAEPGSDTSSDFFFLHRKDKTWEPRWKIRTPVPVL